MDCKQVNETLVMELETPALALPNIPLDEFQLYNVKGSLGAIFTK